MNTVKNPGILKIWIKDQGFLIFPIAHGLTLKLMKVGLILSHHFTVRLDSLDELPERGHDQVHPPQMWLQVLLTNGQVLTHTDPLKGQVGEDFETEDGTDDLQVQLQLGGEFEEVGDEPEEMGFVHGQTRIIGQLLFQEGHEWTVTFQQEMDSELPENVRNVLLRRVMMLF